MSKHDVVDAELARIRRERKAREANDILREQGAGTFREAAPREKKLPKPKPANDTAPEFSEEAIALTFADRHANQLRFVADWGRWLNWNGSVWKPDNINRVFTMSRKVSREMAEACDVPRVATAIASAKTVAAVERLARYDGRLATTGEQWDAKPYLLGVSQGVVDLRTGMESPPNRDNHLTQVTASTIAPPGTPHPAWSRFLDRITDHNAELISFLQRYVGYCATADISEHTFVFGYGTGMNGKGTFINTIGEILGDHATVADMGTFIAGNAERHPTDVAKLRGKRLVIAQETQEGRRWDETKLKALTGGDMLTARFMRQDFFDFKPTFKLFIIGNHKPRLSNVDPAMRRRLLLVPFTVQIPMAERDKHLPEKLKAEWPAILRWVIDGCLGWQRIGLAPPTIVRDATDEYFSGEDVFGQWLDDQCDVDIGNDWKWESVGALFTAWTAYATQSNDQPGTAKGFSEQMQARGFTPCRKGNARTRAFSGIRLIRRGNANDINND
jgi:putative DNA primase/helicase